MVLFILVTINRETVVFLFTKHQYTDVPQTIKKPKPLIKIDLARFSTEPVDNFVDKSESPKTIP